MSIGSAEKEYLLHLLSSVLHATEPRQPPQRLQWDVLYRLCRWHGVSNMLSYALDRLAPACGPPAEIGQQFQLDRKKGLAQEATQHISIEHLLACFEENRIECMPLKGYLLKYLYPQPDMRFMADIDILVKPGQLAHVRKLMLEQGYALQSEGGHHDVYHRQPFMNVEMHHRLVAESSPYSDYLGEVWDRVQRHQGTHCRYELSHEDCYIYLLIHLAKHFSKGGTGIRSVMDIWVYNSYYSSVMDWSYIQGQLDKIELWEFAENIRSLGETWFGGERTNELLAAVGDYVFASGAYGTGQNAVASSINTFTHDLRLAPVARFLYRMKLCFPGVEQMKYRYRFLDTIPFLLPLCWIIRGVRSLLFRRERTLKLLSSVSSISAEDMSRQKELHRRVGLSK